MYIGVISNSRPYDHNHNNNKQTNESSLSISLLLSMIIVANNKVSFLVRMFPVASGFFWKEKEKRKSPTVGLEPTTTRLKALRSTDWARSALYSSISKCSYCCLVKPLIGKILLRINKRFKYVVTLGRYPLQTIPYGGRNFIEKHCLQ